MADLVSLIGIGVGALLVLFGLVLIATQVRIHQIRVYSAGSWIFRVGAVLSALGLVTLLVRGGAQELASVGLVTGVAALVGGLFTLNHERAQSLDRGAERWDWLRSLTAQMVGAGAILIVLALLS